jgi:hypothetical protein
LLFCRTIQEAIAFNKGCLAAEILIGAFMNLEKREPSGREKDQASVKLLEKLREQLHSSNSSTARRAAFNLSWMQEDGLDILKEALFSDATKRAKSAAVYGLRKMRGRMKKNALRLLAEGLKYRDRATVDVCQNALAVLKHKAPGKPAPARRGRHPKFQIRDVSAKKTQRRRGERVRGPGNRFSR